MTNTEHRPSEYDPAPGKPTSSAARAAQQAREAARQVGAPIPPIAGLYSGWDRKE